MPSKIIIREVIRPYIYLSLYLSISLSNYLTISIYLSIYLVKGREVRSLSMCTVDAGVRKISISIYQSI